LHVLAFVVIDDKSEAYLLALGYSEQYYNGNRRVLRSEDGEHQIMGMAWRGFALHVWRFDKSRSTKA
jgi:hypothetical protein